MPFSFASCGDDGSGGGGKITVKVVNNYDKPITKVTGSISGSNGFPDADGLNIANGGSKDFTINLGDSVNVKVSVLVYAEDLGYEGWIDCTTDWLGGGTTITFTLSAAGVLTSDK